MNIGADGLKTGFTDESGYGLVGSAVRDGQRLIVVINGTKTEKERARGGAQAARMGLPGLREGQPLRQGRGDRRGQGLRRRRAHASAWSATGRSISSCRAARATSIKARIVYQGPVPAPIDSRQGDRHPQDHRRRPARPGDAGLRRRRTSPVGTMRQRALDGLAGAAPRLVVTRADAIWTLRSALTNRRPH